MDCSNALRSKAPTHFLVDLPLLLGIVVEEVLLLSTTMKHWTTSVEKPILLEIFAIELGIGAILDVQGQAAVGQKITLFCKDPVLT